MVTDRLSVDNASIYRLNVKFDRFRCCKRKLFVSCIFALLCDCGVELYRKNKRQKRYTNDSSSSREKEDMFFFVFIVSIQRVSFV